MNELPSFIATLPEAAMSVADARGWISQAADHQVVFLQFPAGTKAAPHSHGEQWGVVLAGEMLLTIAGETRRYGVGDWHYVPAGAVHSAEFPADTFLMDVFADADRYRSKPAPPAAST
jgi:quercetin dioxygenase-like cupin family protein